MMCMDCMVWVWLSSRWLHSDKRLYCLIRDGVVVHPAFSFCNALSPHLMLVSPLLMQQALQVNWTSCSIIVEIVLSRLWLTQAQQVHHDFVDAVIVSTSSYVHISPCFLIFFCFNCCCFLCLWCILICSCAFGLFCRLRWWVFVEKFCMLSFSSRCSGAIFFAVSFYAFIFLIQSVWQLRDTSSCLRLLFSGLQLYDSLCLKLCIRISSELIRQSLYASKFMYFNRNS